MSHVICLSYPILSYPILSYPILSYPILSYPILSYPTLSYPILSYPILSYPTLPISMAVGKTTCQLFGPSMAESLFYGVETSENMSPWSMSTNKERWEKNREGLKGKDETGLFMIYLMIERYSQNIDAAAVMDLFSLY